MSSERPKSSQFQSIMSAEHETVAAASTCYLQCVLQLSILGVKNGSAIMHWRYSYKVLPKIRVPGCRHGQSW